MIGVEHDIGNRLIEYPLFDSDARIGTGHLKEKLCQRMVACREQIDGYKGGYDIAPNRKDDDRGKELIEADPGCPERSDLIVFIEPRKGNERGQQGCHRQGKKEDIGECEASYEQYLCQGDSMINHPFGEPQDPSRKDEKGEYNQAGRKIGDHFLKDIDIEYLFHTLPASAIRARQVLASHAY